MSHPSPARRLRRWFGSLCGLFVRRAPVASPAAAPMSRRHVLLALQEAKKRAERARAAETLRQSRQNGRKGWPLFHHMTGK